MNFLPQIIIILLYVASLGMVMVLHGKPRANYNAWNTLISTAITIALLYWGGFFDGLMKALGAK